jgi:cell division transport system permease protein
MSLVFWLKKSFAGFFREKGSAFVSFFVNTFFFLIFCIFLLITYNLYTFTQKVKQRMEIDVYLVEGLTDKENEELRSKIIKIEGVEGAIFRTKEKALQELKNYFGKNILEGLESNPLPSSWVVKLKPAYQNLEKMQKVSSQIAKLKGVEETDYGKFWVEKIDRLFEIFLWTNLVLGILIVTGSLFLMIHTLKTIRQSKAEELTLLNLLGAERSFLRKIFLFEGIMHGGVCAFFSLLILYILHRFFVYFGFELGFLPLSLSIAFVFFGFLLGGVAGLLSGGKKLN